MKKSLLLVSMMAGVASFAQTSYTLTTFSEEYIELTDATPVDLGDEAGEPWDDPEFPVPFGFDFSMNDQTFNSTLQFDYGSLFLFGESPETEHQFFGVYDDLADASNLEGEDASEISYSIEGTPGNQIAKVQYSNSAFYEELFDEVPSAENITNFQIWFYENGGALEVHFGTSTITDAELVYYGNMGPSIILALGSENYGETIDYGVTITGSPESPVLSTITSLNEEPPGLNAVPESGTVYRLAPPNPLGLFDSKAPEFSIYPTITESNLWVKGISNGFNSYRILDITGKEVLSGNMQNQNAVNVSNLNAGVYLFSIDGMANAAKFIKE